MSTYPLFGEIPRGFPRPSGAVDGVNGTQKSEGWDIGIYTHWDGAGNGGAGGDWGVYLHPP